QRALAITILPPPEMCLGVLTPLIPSPFGRGETPSDRRPPSPEGRGGQGVRTPATRDRSRTRRCAPPPRDTPPPGGRAPRARAAAGRARAPPRPPATRAQNRSPPPPGARDPRARRAPSARRAGAPRAAS